MLTHILMVSEFELSIMSCIWPSAIGSMSDCRSKDSEFDPGLVPFFRGD